MESAAKRRWILSGLAAFALLGADLSRAPQSQWSAKALLGAIDVYQATVSRALGAAGAQCRFEPTCSHYGEAAIRRHGSLKGAGMALSRIARCGPWTPAGTVDPVPEVAIEVAPRPKTAGSPER